MTVFILFIVGLGVLMVRNSTSLYEDDYYAKGEAHTAIMQQEKVGQDVDITYTDGSLQVDLKQPGSLKLVTLKCMGNSSLDRSLAHDGNSRQNLYSIRLDPLTTGIWHAEVTGNVRGEDFIRKVQLIIP
ncbi:MAG: FixH family protein [Bacteroidia bacterium]|nr:FixH family protein [Bacteroidia bacterium]